jgi:hypothetical protein
MSSRYPLPRLSTQIGARPEIVFQVIAGLDQGAVSQAGAHHARVLERPGSDRMVVEFTTTVFGRQVVTVEEVVLEPPLRIHYRLIKGPLPEVVEDFSLHPESKGTTLDYTGWFVPNRPLLRRLLDRVAVPILYRRAVGQSMADVKRLAEARQQRSRLFPTPHAKEEGQAS